MQRDFYKETRDELGLQNPSTTPSQIDRDLDGLEILTSCNLASDLLAMRVNHFRYSTVVPAAVELYVAKNNTR
jgi:hypothetical protein